MYSDVASSHRLDLFGHRPNATPILLVNEVETTFADVTMEADPTKAYNQDDATGFIRLNALRLKVAAKVHGKKQEDAMDAIRILSV